jgi:hypothetical protein
MRGCLSFLVFAALLIGVGLWYALPPVTAGLVGIALSTTGFESRDTRVEVTANPPFELLAGHADALSIASTGVRTGRLTAGSLSLDLTDLDLFGRNARETTGTLADVAVGDASGGTLRVRRIDVAGPLDHARATLVVDEAAVADRTLQAIANAGLAVTSVSMAPPDGLVVEALGRRLSGRLTIGPGGAIALELPAIGPVPILSPPPDLRLTFDAVTVAADHALVVEATIDLRSILGG